VSKTDKPSPPFSILRLDHVVLRTTHIDRLRAFYEALGCQVIRSLEEIGLYQLKAGESLVDLLDVSRQGGEPPNEDGRNMEHFALRIDPFDAEAIKEFLAGISDEVTAPPFPLFGADGYGPSIYVKDPDGNTVELKGPPIENQDEPGL
jgi:catechol 2,3-dioxygenase-like lactoylglutathione lyase family enzyme